MRERMQGGSLAGFIIVGVLLALVLVGGLYGLNRYNAEQAQNTADEQVSDEPTTDGEASDEDLTTNDDERATTPDEPTGSDDKASDPATSESPQATATESLPQTGPADTALAILAIAALTFATAHYIRSRAH